MDVVGYGVGVMLGFVAIALAGAAYLAPLIVASIRGRAVAAVAILNIFLGWTLLGWIGALVWAVTERTPREQEARAREQSEAAARRRPAVPG